MKTSRGAPGYDLFKLIVSIVLLILFFILNRRTIQFSPTAISTIAPALTTIPVSGTSLAMTETTPPPASQSAANAAVSTVTLLLSPTTTIPPIASVSLSSSPTAINETLSASTDTAFPLPNVTKTAEPAATPLPSPTTTSSIKPTATPEAVPTRTQTPTSETTVASACESASARSRLQPGINGTILRRLNFRSSPGIQNNWLRTNLPGTKVEVIGGPECIPYFAGAYVWWQIKLPNGQTGWSAESSQFGSFYFIEPMP